VIGTGAGGGPGGAGAPERARWAKLAPQSERVLHDGDDAEGDVDNTNRFSVMARLTRGASPEVGLVTDPLLSQIL
jgi:hypothetical protein